MPFHSKKKYWLQVVLNLPLDGPFDYQSSEFICSGMRVIVPFGRRNLFGVVISNSKDPSISPTRIREIKMVLDDLPPFKEDWLRYVRFVSDYYHHPLGQVISSVLPNSLRSRSLYEKNPDFFKKHLNFFEKKKQTIENTLQIIKLPDSFSLTFEQKTAIKIINSLKNPRTILLYGVTGSGKTEVYLQIIQDVLILGFQVLIMVPEINLTPQLEQQLRDRLEVFGSDSVAVMHSGLTNTQRAKNWAKIQLGVARIALGTRLSVFLPFQNLGLIIVDEEHDVSYKQFNGFHYSARDLAVWRARDLGISVILGSATPSLESWFHSESGKYLRIELKNRAKVKEYPKIHLINSNSEKKGPILSKQLIDAMENRLRRKEQSLIFLNRRGYAPVLYCTFCSWISNCPRCTVFTVLHKSQVQSDDTLNCHQCGYESSIISICPNCGNQNLKPLGYGTQRIAEHIRKLFPEARIVRIDADNTQRKKSASDLFKSIHSGKVDILVGTQMVSKGHDFRNLTLIGILNADSLLFTQDFRGPEKLFSQLMQVIGRAGRHIENSDVFIETEHPENIVYQSLLLQDYEKFACNTLYDRKITCLPPYTYQALLTATSRNLSEAIAFLQKAKELLKEDCWLRFHFLPKIMLHDPVPLRIMRIANIERAQILIESRSRPYLQEFLQIWKKELKSIITNNDIRWKIEIDPLEI